MEKQFAGVAGTDLEGTQIAYFGYGSLVNRATLRTDIVDIIPARLVGWRRIWRPRPDMPGFPAALLTVRREPGSVCDGVLIVDRAENLAAVDAREARYRRIRLEPVELEISPAREGAASVDVPIYVYEADPELPPHREPPMILQSYLDAVMQGFLAVHGEEGLRRFLAETYGFAETPIRPDREKPTYPRAVMLSDVERALFDTLYGEHGLRLAAG
ncbi:MAG: gamma-glutamylcyclotransferase [Hyphomicrobiales bacterium]|nr:gamma-glutamylcyclotransferase [Hyphomicrobiales bacterium]